MKFYNVIGSIVLCHVLLSTFSTTTALPQQPSSSGRTSGRSSSSKLSTGTNKQERKSSSKFKSPRHQQQQQQKLQRSKRNNNNNNNNVQVVVESILIPRTIRYRQWIRMLCMVTLLFSLQQCWITAGRPLANAVWELLYSTTTTNLATSVPQLQQLSPPPSVHNFVPTAMELVTAQILATCTIPHQLLPPTKLPSVKPLLGAIGSILLHVLVTILFPQWFIPFQVLLDYQRISLPIPSSSSSSSSGRKYQNAYILVRPKEVVDDDDIDVDEHAATNDNNDNDDVSSKSSSTSWLSTKHKGLQICSLHPSFPHQPGGGRSSGHSENIIGATSKWSSNSSAARIVHSQYSHPCPIYFEWNQCRIYLDTSTGDCMYGGPTFHEAQLQDLYEWSLWATTNSQTNHNNKNNKTINPNQLYSKKTKDDDTNYYEYHDVARQRYGPYNRYATQQVLLPTLLQAIGTRLASPLVVVQIIGRLVSILEDGWSETVVNLFETISRHVYNAKQAIQSAEVLAAEIQHSVQDASNRLVWVLRDTMNEKELDEATRLTTTTTTKSRNRKKSKKQRKVKPAAATSTTTNKQWVQTEAVNLLPGDIFVINLQQKQQQHQKNPAATVESNGTSSSLVIPVDALVLKGQCLTNEAVLTGESVPQSKVPMDFFDYTNEENGNDDNDKEEEEDTTVTNDDGKSSSGTCLDLQDHRQSILFAGTTMVHCSSTSHTALLDNTTRRVKDDDAVVEDDIKRSGSRREKKQDGKEKNVVSGVLCLALRTGTYSSKGELLRTLQSNSHVGAISNPQSERDVIRLIGSLSIVAAMSCLSLFVPLHLLPTRRNDVGLGLGNNNDNNDNNKDNNNGNGREWSQPLKPVSGFRRVIQCTRIIVASIPSDLPLSLSAVARTCAHQLRQEADVVCSEPGSLLTAAHVDMVVFDKTGTLTADTQSLSKLVPPKKEVSGVTIHPRMQRFILAGCHSLIHLTTNNDEEHSSSSDSTSSEIVGDPLDVAALQYSGWKYNSTQDCYNWMPMTEEKASNDTDLISSESYLNPVRLWQIKTFPFDSNRRMSSSIVLTELEGGHFRVWHLTKGSPDTLSRLFGYDKNSSGSLESYNNQIQQLESSGFRTIGLGGKDLTNSAELIQELFPDGISSSPKALRRARSTGSSLHRKDFEGGPITPRPNENLDLQHKHETPNGLEFYGFACFDAAIRPSSGRILGELRRGGLQVMMLTGDAIDAALAVARKVGLIKGKIVAILESDDDELVWKVVKLTRGKSGGMRGKAKIEPVTMSSVKDVLRRQRQGSYSIAATGRAVELLLESGEMNSGEHLSKKVRRRLARNLFRFSVIARATPVLKKSVISTLKRNCGKKVLMCGDGVNDVAAMKNADAAVALLNGFGSESLSDDGIDHDEERRRQRLAKSKIGSNRKSSTREAKKSARNDPANIRLQAAIKKEHEKITSRAATRGGLEPGSSEIQYSLTDMKDMISATMKVALDERRRAKELKKGGGEAARILAEETRGMEGGDEDHTADLESIKPGEASLVATFSCLRPSIAGVDSILRAGLASAACSLSTQQSIVLSSLMASFNLASLYRDGFRYGNKMWQIELTLYLLLSNASYKSSCTPRPRLPTSMLSRPHTSLFHPAYVISTIAQAGAHLVSITVGVLYGKVLEARSINDSRVTKTAPRIRAVQLGKSRHMAQLASALLDKLESIEFEDTSKEEENRGIFRRRPFRPNYETNIVFILSLLQSAISSLVNHKGKPFYRSILESRQLCKYAGLTILFSVACITESFPWMNNVLELRRLPSKKSKLVLLSIASINMIACVLIRVLTDLLLPADSTSLKKEDDSASAHAAADEEEKLLREETEHNRFMALVMLALGANMVFDAMVRRS